MPKFHQTRLHDILWWHVLSQGILTRSRGDSRHHGDDTPSDKTGATFIFRSSELSPGIRSPQSSHWTTTCTPEKGEQLCMGLELQHSFQKIKSLLEKVLLKLLRYYDRHKPVTLQCDASLKGLGACIIQNGQPIAFVSKSHRHRDMLLCNWYVKISQLNYTPCCLYSL